MVRKAVVKEKDFILFLLSGDIMKKIIMGVIIITLILGSEAVAESTYPIQPAAYYGSITVNGQPAAAGTTIIAKISGGERGRITTESSGVYGSIAGSGHKLLVEGTIDESGSSTVQFYIGSVAAPQTATWATGEVKTIDLTFSGVPGTTTGSSQGGSSTSGNTNVAPGSENASGNIESPPEEEITTVTSGPAATIVPEQTIETPGSAQKLPIWAVVLIVIALIGAAAYFLVVRKK